MYKTTPLVVSSLLLFSTAQACEMGVFIARQNASFTNSGDAWTQEFSLTGTSSETFVLRFAAVYSASAIIIDAADAEAFRNGAAVSYYKGFDGNFGTQSVTLGAGNYAVAIRNKNNGTNNYSLELDCATHFADATPIDSRTSAEAVSANGGKLWQALDTQDGYRLWVDGVSYGLETYLIPESELTNFQNDRQFQYYEGYGSIPSGNQPGGYEIKLPAGRHYLVFRNNNDTAMPVTYTLELFQLTDPSSSQTATGEDGSQSPSTPTQSASDLTFEGNSSFRIASNSNLIEASIERLVNYRSTTMNNLQLRWLASTDGSLSSVYTIGELDLADVSGISGSLDSGQGYRDMTLSVPYQAPPYGRYQIILAVVSSQDPSTALDTVTYDGYQTLGEAPSSDNGSTDSDSSTGSSGGSSGGGSPNLLNLLLLAALARIGFGANKKH